MSTRELAERIIALLSDEQSDPAMAVEISLGQHEQPPSGLVDAATLAAILAVQREWVWAHAKQLGGIRLGGSRGRLRFDPATAREQMTEPSEPSPASPSHPSRHHRSRRRPSASCGLPPARGTLTRLAASRGQRGAKTLGAE